jgi:ribonuclease Z
MLILHLKTPLIFTAFASLLVSCESSTNGLREFAISLPSARIESREIPSQREMLAKTKVVVLGTGTPIPDAHRAGPSIAVIHKGNAYLFDAGAGAVRQATIARYLYDIPSLYPSQICCVFLSHLHSDHTLDLSELAHTLWWRRSNPLLVWGPEGISRISKAITDMIAIDADFRIKGLQPVANSQGFNITDRTIEPGLILQRDDLRVEAFLANHGDISPAYGFKIVTDDLSIVISGDTAYSDLIAEKSAGVDLLFHEVISRSGLQRNSPAFQRYHNSVHTTSDELARLANLAQPKKLILYHGLFYGTNEGAVLDEIGALYDGEVILAKDLDVFRGE